MVKVTLKYILLSHFLCGIIAMGQEKTAAQKSVNPKSEVVEKDPVDDMVMKTTEMSKKTSIVSDQTNNDKKAPFIEIRLPAVVEDSKKMKALLSQRKQLYVELSDADKRMNELRSESFIWDQEKNPEKKGQLDIILDKAERLAFSNELRMKLSDQYEIVSSIIRKLNFIEDKIVQQKIEDDEKRLMEAYKKEIEKLHKEKMALEARVESQETNTNTEGDKRVARRMSEENVEYFTITEDTNLQTIALSYYQDFEKWVIIYEYPDNTTKLKEKSPTTLIPIGTVLTIPKLSEEY